MNAENLNNIVEIEIEKLFGHPNNPRKDVGDVTELAESIKSNGLMQNLTVVPGHWESGEKKEDLYTVIIGHRRLAAAKKAGLKTVPCAIRCDMSEKEQIATMIAENMQRVDLTVVEQAESMQMMIDLGDTVDTVAEKTGLSQSTVRNRLKIASLDRQALRESEKRQVTIGDYMRLMEIENESTRNIVLCFAGTKNFDRECQKAIDAQTRAKKHEEVVKSLQDNGVNVVTIFGEDGKWMYNGWVGYDHLQDVIDLAKRKKVVAKVDDYGITTFIEKTKEKEAEIAKVKERDEFIRRLDSEIDELQYPLIERATLFVKEYKEKSGDRLKILSLYAKESLYDFRTNERFVLLDVFDVPKEKISDWNSEKVLIQELYNENPAKLLLALLLSAVENHRLVSVPMAFHAKELRAKMVYNKDHYIDLFRLMEDIGDFNIADEEMEYLNGTHQIYDEVYIIDEEAK